jgi:hypothetical protein
VWIEHRRDGTTAFAFSNTETDKADEMLDFLLRTDWGKRYLHAQTKCYDQLLLPEVCDEQGPVPQVPEARQGD